MKELLVYHADPEWLEDAKSLQRYIQSELNVRDVLFTSDETLSGVCYKAVADWSILGKKLRKDLAKVKNALPSVSSDEIKQYIEMGKLSVAGIELVEGDLTVQRYIELPSDAVGQFATQTDNDVVVRLDIQAYPDLTAEWLVRELINRVQKLRKKAGLQATDDVEVYYRFNEDDGTELLGAMKSHSEVLEKTVRNVPVDSKERKQGKQLLIEEEQEISDVKFMLSLVKP